MKRLTSAQVGKVLGLTGERVRQLACAGKLKFIHTPLGRLYDSQSVQALKRERARKRTTHSRRGQT